MRVSNEEEAERALVLIRRILGYTKSVARMRTEEGQPWPEEVRAFRTYLRGIEDELEQRFPDLTS